MDAQISIYRIKIIRSVQWKCVRLLLLQIHKLKFALLWIFHYYYYYHYPFIIGCREKSYCVHAWPNKWILACNWFRVRCRGYCEPNIPHIPKQPILVIDNNNNHNNNNVISTNIVVCCRVWYCDYHFPLTCIASLVYFGFHWIYLSFYLNFITFRLDLLNRRTDDIRFSCT